MIRDLFLDLDDTLLDFGEAERHGIIRTLRELGIAPTEETLALYSRINQQQWERFERGEISREQVLIERFSLLFQALGCTHDPEDAENRYRRYLGIGHWFVPGAEAPAQLARPALPSLSGLERRGGHAVQPSGERRDLPLFSGNFHFGGHGLSQAGKGLF